MAYRFEDGPRLGWEAKGGWALASAAIGQTFSLAEGEDTVFFAAAEPGLLVGASLGVDVTSKHDSGFLRGAWLGAPVYPWDDTPRDRQMLGMDPFLSVAIGYRYVHGHELYFAPKYFLMEDVRLAH